MFRNIIIVLIASVMLSGCSVSPAKLYIGDKSEDEIAIILQPGPMYTSDAYIDIVDGRRVHSHGDIHLTPGAHQLHFWVGWCFILREAYFCHCSGDIEFMAEAGRRYNAVKDVKKRPVELAVVDQKTNEIIAKGQCTTGCDSILDFLNFAPEDACATPLTTD